MLTLLPDQFSWLSIGLPFEFLEFFLQEVSQGGSDPQASLNLNTWECELRGRVKDTPTDFGLNNYKGGVVIEWYAVDGGTKVRSYILRMLNMKNH